MSKIFNKIKDINSVGMNILKQRYFLNTESSWEELVSRVVDNIFDEHDERYELIKEMINNLYFLPNSPCLVNAGKDNGGLFGCYVVDFPDNIEGIYKTKLDFALIARKGGGCGTTLTKIRPKNSRVSKSSHGYAGGPVDFYNTICHDMEVMTQSGFRSMAMMGTISIYHPDILYFLFAKYHEDKMTTTNLSIVVDDFFMRNVEHDSIGWHRISHDKWGEGFLVLNTEDNKYYPKLKQDIDNQNDVVLSVGELFNLIVDSAWRNGEPGILFLEKMNDSPYKYTEQEILATNPCVSGDTLIHTTDGIFRISDLIGKSVDVYCMDSTGNLAISKGSNVRRTKENVELVKVRTTRGYIKCTPDHLIYTKNRGYIQAKDLNAKDKIVGFNKRLSNEKYISVGLTGKGYKKEHRLIKSYYSDIKNKVVHHIDSNTINNVHSNLEVMSRSAHSVISNNGHNDWSLRDSKTGKFLSKDIKKKKESISPISYNPIGANLRIISIEYLDIKEDVYDMTVMNYHNYLANDIIVHNCAEQPLPFNGCCNLGSLDISKFLYKGRLDLEKLELATRLSVNFLDSVIDINSYPTKEIEEWSYNNRPIGLGIMGFADFLLGQKVEYGSKISTELLEFILHFIYKIAEDESIILGKEKGIPKECKKLPIPRRNITLLTIAPTGTISLIAGCSSGIEPIFSEVTIRNDNTGTYQFENELINEPYFKCAVSMDGGKEVTWEEHLNILNSANKFIDSGVSKTINCPQGTKKQTIHKIFKTAYELPNVKGITIYRNGSREVEVLSPKNLKKDLCPYCESEMIKESSCTTCSNKECQFSYCEVFVHE